MNNSNSVYSIF